MKNFLLLSISTLIALSPLSRAQTLTISTLAGNAGQISADGTGGGARFNNPWGVAVDASGNTYVADTDSHCIRKITSGGVVTTIAGLAGVSGSTDSTGSNARFNSPQGIAVDNSGNLFVTDSANHTIRQITPSGAVTTLAGSAGISGTTDDTGSNARFNNPEGIVLSGTTLYVADTWNHTIRAVTTNNGTVTTFAGTAGTPGSNDGNGTSALFNSPQGIAIDASGNIYVADTGNQLIRLITSGTVSTFAGVSGTVGSTDGATGSALFSDPNGVAVDSANNVYVSDAFNNTIRKIASGVVSTPFGTAGVLGSTDGTGSAVSFWQPQGVAVDASGNIYVAEGGNGAIRKISGTTVATLAGSPSIGSADGLGSSAHFAFPADACITDTGTTYVADTLNHTIRAINTAGSVSTLAGSAGVSGTTDGNGTSARFNAPQGLALDNSGNLYVADTGNHTIRKVTSGGSVSLFAGSAGTSGWFDATGASALFNYPQDVAVDSSGNVYVADTWNHLIRKITSGGVVTTLAGQGGVYGDSDGTGPAVGTNIARFYAPGGLTVDGSGNVFVADTRNHIIRQVTPSGVVSTIAGLGGSYGSTDGASNNARFFFPQSIAVDASGNLFVLDSGNQTIRKLTVSGGIWTATTVAGTAGVFGSADGTGPSAQFFDPAGIAVNSSGTVVIADLANNTIRTSGTVAPTILTSPSSQSVAQSHDATFSVSFNGTSLSYQWYFNTVLIPGANDTTYTRANAQTSDAGSYSVIANNSLGSATSCSAILTVIVPPSISLQPQSQTVGVGTNVTLSIAASGTSPFYQWLKNGGTLSGANDSSLPLPRVSHSDDASYSVIVSNSAGTVTSSVATVTVLDPPTITVPPASQTVAAQTTVQFSVIATGNLLSYQWKKNGGDIGSATGSSVSLANVADADAANYAVVVSNAAGSLTSSAAVLTVVDPPMISQPPTAQTVATGSTAQFIVTATGGFLNYQWQKNGGPIGGAITSVLSLPNVSTADVANYRVVVTNIAGATTSVAATLSVMDAPAITQPPSSVTANPGDNVQFSVTATGPSLSYQWRKDGTNIPSATISSLTLNSVVPLSGGNYDVVVTNLVGSVTSTAAVLTIQCATISISPAVLPTINVAATPANFVPSGGAAPYTFALTSGSLPNGLSLDTNGVWSGIAYAFGTNTFTVMATDSNGCFTTSTYTLSVVPSGKTTDNGIPGVTIKTPANKSALSSSSLTITGVAGDGGTIKTGVAVVLYSFNGAPQQLVTPVHTYTNWSASVTLLPGWNTFVAQSTDNRGKLSKAVTNLYLLGATSNVLGSYNGLFYETNNSDGPAIVEKSAGLVANIAVTLTGAFSGRIYLAGTNYPLRGKFDLAGNCSTNVSRGFKPMLSIALHLDWSGTTKQITGTVSCATEGWVSPLLADLATFNIHNPHATVRYTIAIAPATNAPTSSPGGYGYGAVTINVNGAIGITGALADSTALPLTSHVSKDGRWPLYGNLYRSQGLIEGWIDFSSGAPAGVVTWIKPANTGVKPTSYLDGFTNDVNVFGSVYTPVLPGITPADSLLDITDGSGLNLPLTLGATISATDTLVRTAGTNALTGSIAKGSGITTIHFRPTGTRITKTGVGVVLQSSNAAYGAFIGNNDGTGKTNTGAFYLH